MAVPTRVRRAFTAMETDIRRRLRESTSAYWGQADLLQFFNEMMDLRVMDLALADEGWVTSTFKTNIVEKQREYSLPEGAGRLKRILWSVTDNNSSSGTRETPMNRDEKHYSSSGRSSSLFGYGSVVPTYRIEHNLIILEPTPENAQNDGMWIQCEFAPARLISTAKLDLQFPDIMETMLILDTVVEAIRVESSRAGGAPAGLDDAIATRDRFEINWIQFIQDHSAGPVSAVPYYLGD